MMSMEFIWMIISIHLLQNVMSKRHLMQKEYKKSSYKKKKKSIYTCKSHRVNTLVKQMKKAVKSVDPNVTYGISPAGNIDNLTSKYSYYVDIYKWLNSTEYVDYICPQVYWRFKHPTAKFNKVTDRWIKAAKSKKVKLYIGIAVYRAGHNVGQNRAERKEWKRDTKVLKKCGVSKEERNMWMVAFLITGSKEQDKCQSGQSAQNSFKINIIEIIA